MGKRLFFALVTFGLALGTLAWAPTPAQAEEQGGLPDRTGKFELSPFFGGYVFDGHDRREGDRDFENSWVAGGRLGYWLTKNWEAELSIEGLSTDNTKDASAYATLYQGHVDALYNFNATAKLVPYLAAGLGMARYNSKSWWDSGDDLDNSFLVNYGAGLKYFFTDWLAARLDVRQPVTFSDPNFNFMYTGGLSLLLPIAAPAAAAPPTASLRADPNTIRQGQATTLSWTTENATEAFIDGLGSVDPNGARQVTPAASVTYRLTAKGPGGTAESTAAVTVTAPPPPTAPPTAWLSANPSTVEKGQCTTLSWETKNATDVSIEGLGSVDGSGSKRVCPDASTTYRLNARGPGGSQQATAGVAVTTPPAPQAPAAPWASLTANPSTVEKGKCTTLSWDTKNATDVSIEGIGKVEPSGSKSVCPPDSTTYRLTASGPGGTQTATAGVAVTQPPVAAAPTAVLTANPTTVQKGQCSTLSWDTKNATDVSIEGIGKVEPTGSKSVCPPDSTTYRLTASGPGGSEKAEASVAVTAPPAMPKLELLINFDFDKAVVKPQYFDQVKKVADFMAANPKATAVIEGHTDNVGAEEYNLKLSTRRANAVAKMLTEKYGIDMQRITAQSLGETQPIAPNTTKEGRAKNRRVYAIFEAE